MSSPKAASAELSSRIRPPDGEFRVIAFKFLKDLRMFLKTANYQLLEQTSDIDIARRWTQPEAFERWADRKKIALDPDRFVYLRNRAISSLESHGPNDNGDAFEREQLTASYLTFLGVPSTVDHTSADVIGSVVDTVWTPIKKEIKARNGENVVIGDWVENVHAIDKERTERFHPGLVEAILDGEVTDTSMGCLVETSICNVCQNVATTESEFCDHIRDYKGKQAHLGANGELVHVAEINRDITFFEDSVILPIRFGGTAGGQGADPSAKILERLAGLEKHPETIATTPLLDIHDITEMYRWLPQMTEAQKTIAAKLLKAAFAS